MRDGAQVLFKLVFGHANAGVGHRDGTSVAVEGHMNSQLVLAYLDVGISQAFEIELVHGVGCVGDKLAQEDFLVGVDRINHEIEQFFALCLEFLHGMKPSFMHRAGEPATLLP